MEDSWNMSKKTGGAGRGTPLKDAAKQREAEVVEEINNEMNKFIEKSLDNFLTIKKGTDLVSTRYSESVERRITEDYTPKIKIDKGKDLTKGSLCCSCY